MNKFCIAITLYYPTDEQISKIENYLETFDKVLLVDNTPAELPLLEKSTYSLDNENIIFLSNGVNLGMSCSLNLICNYAGTLNFDFCCVVDQDSEFYIENIKQMESFINTFDSKDVALFSPKIEYLHSKKKNISTHESELEPEFNYIEWAITSGSFINIKLFQILNGFDENYFIDRLELDFCEHARNEGYQIVQYNKVILNQELGHIRNLLFGFKIYEHTPLRNYYMFRNRIYFFLVKSNSNVIQRIGKLTLLSFRHFLKIMFLETNKKSKCYHIALAIYDAFRGSFGQSKH
jgi:rhamnosyltransferase